MRTGFTRFYILILLAAGISGAYGQTAGTEQIVHRASVWMRHQPALKTQPVADSVISLDDTGNSTLYAVTFKPEGFVILSGEGNNCNILGWSDAGEFPENPLHPLRNWLISSYTSVTLHSSLFTLHSLKSSMSTDDAIDPLIVAKWGQGDSWNRFCPADSNGQHALVGCVSVAMAQIMRYWQWPEQGYGSVTYTPLMHPDYGEISIGFDTTYYQWDQMDALYPTDASRLILFHSGAASYMNYGPTESATSIDEYALPALQTNFRYQKGMISREQEGFTFAQWLRMLKEELINGRPVLYSGTSPDGKSAHAFNLDGFRGDYYFHFNWGWSGTGDGWYTLPEMAGGSADFSSMQAAVFGMQPSVRPLHDRPSTLEVLPGDGFVQLFWQQPIMADLSHYTVYRNGEKMALTAENSFRDTALQNGTTCLYEVTASYGGETPGESEPTPGVITYPWAAITPGYHEGFESEAGGWQMMQDQSGFMVGLASDLGFGGNAGRIAAIRSEGLPSGCHATDYLTSPVIFPSAYTHLAVSFDYVYMQNPETDIFFLMYRDFLTGLWQPITRLDSTGGLSSWTNFHIYLPKPASNAPIQIAFYYNDFYGDGYGAAVDNIRIYEVPEMTVPAFRVTSQDICEGQSIVYTSESTGPIDTWLWDFGQGAEPRYANTPGPHEVFYSDPGKISVKLSLNRLDHLIEKDFITIRNQPIAGFDTRRSAMDVYFTSTARHAEELLWYFGDGATSTEFNPKHTYYNKFLFEVKQLAFNGSCPADTMIFMLDLSPGSGTDEYELAENLVVQPNPTTGRITLLWNILPSETVNINVLTQMGQVLMSGKSPASQNFEIDLSGFPDGIYILRIISGRTIRTIRVMKI
ncbi:MAG: C10 family peptidase [Bacteroidota bacterium]